MFFTGGSAQNYAKSMQLQYKWQLKKQGFVEEKKTIGGIDIAEEQKKIQMNSIVNKMKSGKRLTSSEMAYLRANAPELYEKAQKIEQERDEYKRELKKCKSKEEVQKLHLAKMQQFADEVKSIRSSGMDQGAKQEALEFVQMRVMNILDEHRSFVESAAYKKLPDKAKKNKIKNVDWEMINKQNQDLQDLLERLKQKKADGKAEQTKTAKSTEALQIETEIKTETEAQAQEAGDADGAFGKKLSGHA